MCLNTKWLEEEDQARILAHLKEPIRTFFLFCMKTGVRQGEARALRWERGDMKEGVAVIAAGMDGEVYRASTKEKNVRLLPLTVEVVEALKQLPRNLTGWVFGDGQGNPITRNQVRGGWPRAAEKAGLKISSYQGTRHSLASQLVNEGVPLNLIQNVLGHKTPDMVRRYAKTKLSTLRGVLERRAAQ